MASLPSRISTTTARGGLFRKVGNFFGQNPIVGNVIEGIGSGLLNLAASRDQLNAQRDLEAQRQEQIRQNYQGTNPGQTFSDVGRRPGLSPVDRFSPDYYGRLRYRYDPRSRTIVEETEGG